MTDTARRWFGPEPRYEKLKTVNNIPDELIVIGGPCSAEDPEQLNITFKLTKRVKVPKRSILLSEYIYMYIYTP